MRVALETLIARRFAVHGADAQIDNLEQAIHDFDAALYAAKQAGRNRVIAG